MSAQKPPHNKDSAPQGSLLRPISAAPAVPAVNVAAGIIWDSGRFLAAKRPEGKPHAGFWEFPGGKQEHGESIEETLVRELFEELGIHCGAPQLWQNVEHSYPHIHVTLHFMHVYEFSGSPRPRDGQELRWVTPQEATLLSFLPADKGILTALAARVAPAAHETAPGAGETTA